MQVKSSLAALLLLMLMLPVLYLYSSRPPYAVTVSAPHRPADAWLGDPRAARHAPQRNLIQLDAPQLTPSAPLASQIDQLVATGAPDDALRAYWLVQACVDLAEKGANHLRGLTYDESQAQRALCGGMTERIKMSRLDHLAIAARAGVSGADDAFLRVGPFGDRSALKTRPDDPLVKAWRIEAEQLLTAHAEAGDMSSMLTLMQEYSGVGGTLEADPALALRYTYAVSDIFERMLSRSGAGFANPYKVEVDLALKAGLSTAQRSAAIAAGKAMAETAARRLARNRALLHTARISGNSLPVRVAYALCEGRITYMSPAPAITGACVVKPSGS